LSRRVLGVPYLRWRVVGKTLLHHRLPKCSTRVCDPQQFKVTDVPIKYHRGFQKAWATTRCREKSTICAWAWQQQRPPCHQLNLVVALSTQE
jgi:hypothetical protein